MPLIVILNLESSILKKNKRYPFWKVFWVVLAVYVFFMIIGIAFASLVPTEKPHDLSEMLQWKRLVNQAVNLLFSVAFFYYTLNIFYRLFAEKKGAFNFVKYSLISALALAAYNFASFYLLWGNEELKTRTKTETIPFALLILSFSFAITFQLGFSLLIAYLTYLRDEKKQRKILEEQKMQLEIEKSQANFNFLKAQINPHFLHNTLNFLYAKSLPYSPELSEGILTLSDIMRYALSEGNARDGKAPLSDEIEHVRNVIKINQLRFSNKLNVKFEVEGVVNGATIIPFVLITLVENAFKHGDLKSNEFPIRISLGVDDHKIYFVCRNKKKGGPKELSTGIGLDNIKKRLDLAYGKNYSLNIKDEAELYTTELTITSL
jgi:two-component system, LytTR family, sensor kinase